MKYIKAPNPYRLKNRFSLFLAGSIEMGSAKNWQNKITKSLSKLDGITILNPRRDDWDSSWKQTIDDPQFYEQVNWELQGLEDVDLIIMYFDPKTKSPISLLELGLYASSGKMLVCCPEGFWRKGNVEIVCERFNVPLFENLDELITEVKKELTI